MTIEFELQISSDKNDYYLTIINEYRKFFDKNFNDELDVRKYLKNEFNLSNAQIDVIFNKASKNGGSTTLNEENECYIDIDEQMHEMQDKEVEYAEMYAEMYSEII